MKSSRTKAVKPQSHTCQQTPVSFFESRPRQESLHGEAMKRKLDFAEMVSQGRTVLTRHFQKQV